MSKIFKAAGVIPDIRDAWPIVDGLILCIFCFNSLDRPEMNAMSKFLGIFVFFNLFYFLKLTRDISLIFNFISY